MKKSWQFSWFSQCSQAAWLLPPAERKTTTIPPIHLISPQRPIPSMLTISPDTMNSTDGKYVIAMVTDVGQLKDKSFNQGTWNGVKLYASQNSKSYKYYQPANDSNANDEDRYNAFVAAITGGAEIIVTPGFLQEAALKRVAAEYPDVKFVFIDGYPLQDAAGNDLKNIAAVAFKEEQCGYLARLRAVVEGNTKLGFTGGGAGTNPAVNRYGYGFVQGIQDAAKAQMLSAKLTTAIFTAPTTLHPQSFRPW